MRHKQLKNSLVKSSENRRFISESMTVSPYLLRRLRSFDEAAADILEAKIVRERVANAANVISINTLTSTELRKKARNRRSVWHVAS